MSLSIYPNLLLSDERQFDLEFDKVESQIEQLYKKTNCQQYTSLEQLGLDNTFTLTDLALKLPRFSVFRLDAISSVHTNLELPVSTNGSRLSGQLIASNHGNSSKVYFYWQNEFAAAHAMYNTFVSPVLGDWIYFKNYWSVGIVASDYSGELANVDKAGEYYISSSESGNFTDLPAGVTGVGFFVDVNSLVSTTTNTIWIQEVTANEEGVRTWKRRVINGSASGWVSVV
ncbi:MAG: hypothetical protein AAGJ58_21440 [Pseudomonadota bacterium]